MPRVALVLLTVLTAAGCRSGGDGRGAGDAPPARGVVFVLIDALRASHLGAYGYQRPTSPHIDAVAAEGTLFENALTTAPWTLPAMGSVWTGLYPSVHGATKRSNEAALATSPAAFRPMSVLDASRTTLAEMLHREGIATAAFVDGVYGGALFGFARGFDRFVEEGPTGARMNVEAALAWLDEARPSRFFVYLHLVDVHSPYLPTQIPAASPGRPGDDGAAALLRQEQQRFRQFDFDPGYGGTVDGSQPSLARLRAAEPAPDARDVEHLIALYDRGIAYTDYWIGQLVAGLRRRGLLDHTLLMITADHGEEFFDHGALEHGVNQYDEVMKVPLIVRQAPTAARRVTQQASLLDVTPTVLAFFGLQIPSGLHGISLLPALAGDPLPDRILFSEADQSGRVKAMRSNSFKFIRHGARRELYDLRVDARETQNLCPPGEAGACDDFAGMMEQWEAEMARRAALGPTPPEAAIDPGTRERLRALGYQD
jgi:arylsulfatase